MDEQEIKKLRHSFTSKDDAAKVSVNQFGHTVLGHAKNIDTSEINVSINEYGEISAEPSASILDNLKLGNFSVSDHEKESSILQPKTHHNIPVNSANISDLLTELDKMDGTYEAPNIHPRTFDHSEAITTNVSNMKRCANESCLYALPKDATFCLKCGTYQAPKFCTECGYKFPSIEKFCPDCGTKR